MDCGSKGCGFDSLFLPINLNKIIYLYNSFNFNKKNIFLENLTSFLNFFFFFPNYFNFNKIIWEEGFLIDFLQKKIVDNWLKKFVIFSSYFFNEKLVFDSLIKFYLNLLIKPFHFFSIFEFNSVANLLFITIFFFSIIFIFFIFFFLYILIFN